MARETIDQLARRLAESLPQGVRAVRDDLEQNFRTILNSGLARLDLVTREEFEVQEAVLARTRAKLEALEQRLESMESPASAAGGPARSAPRKTAGKKTAKKTKSRKKPAAKSSAKKTAGGKKKAATRKKT